MRVDGLMGWSRRGPATHSAKSIRRVALVLQSTALGGMETHCIELAGELTRGGLKVIAVIPEGRYYDELERRFTERRASVSRVTTDARAGRIAQLAGMVRLSALFFSWRPDVVHLHTGGATGGAATVLLARALTGRATTVTEHDVPVENPGLNQRALRRLMDGFADSIVAVSRRNAFLRTKRLHTPHRKLAAVLNGVPTADIPDRWQRAANRRDLKAQLEIEAHRLVIGSLVRLADGKGLDDLIRAFAIVRAEHECTLLLVGDGPLRPNLESLARELGVSQHVRFAGHQTEAARFLDAMDVFVLAVPAGSMSMALLEAMARGLPAVITYCGPEEPVIDGVTGLCAPPANPAGLAQALTRLSREPDLRSSLGAAGRAHVSRYFSVERVAADLLELYSVCRGGAVPERLSAGREPELGHARPAADPCAVLEANS